MFVGGRTRQILGVLNSAYTASATAQAGGPIEAHAANVNKFLYLAMMSFSHVVQ
jgi:hypothetical protein